MTKAKILVSVLLESDGEFRVVDVESAKEARRDDGEEAGEGLVQCGGRGEGVIGGGGVEVACGRGMRRLIGKVDEPEEEGKAEASGRTGVDANAHTRLVGD